MMSPRVAARVALSMLVVVLSCGEERDMPETVEMPDQQAVERAMHDHNDRDALLDTMPGGEMVRGDSLAEMKLLEEKM